MIGIDYIGLGYDFDGINLTLLQLDDITTEPLITKALVEKGYCEEDIIKILGSNLLRVLEQLKYWYYKLKTCIVHGVVVS